MRHPLLCLAAFASAVLLASGCGGSDEGGGDNPPTGSSGKGGKAGAAGSAQGGKAGSGAGSAGASGAGQAGAGGAAGNAGAGQGGAGAGGSAGGGASGAGQAGSAGQGGSAGSGGSAGQAGAAGSAGSAGGEGGSAGAGGSAGSGGSGGSAGSGGCTSDGIACGEGKVCAGGACCDQARVCGGACCGGTQVCSFQKCVQPGVDCLDRTDCAAGEYCEYALGEQQGPGGSGGAGGQCVGSVGNSKGKCLPQPPECPDGQSPPPDKPITCLGKCEVKPGAAAFEVELKYSWGGQVDPPYDSDVMMTPIVMELDDDDCDGKITERDIPEILFTTFSGGAYTAAGTLHAISIVNGKVVDKWSVPGVIAAAAELAAGNIDGEPGNEVVGCGIDGFVYAFRGDGTQLWKSAEPVPCRMPAIADLDQDGKPEVINHSIILNGKDGTTKTTISSGGYGAVADVDGDGKLDYVSSSTITHVDGTVVANTNVGGSWNAIGDLDKDGVPEIVMANASLHSLTVWHYDASKPEKYTIIRNQADINALLDPNGCGAPPPAGYPGGGPPTVADFNGDGFPDIALAGGLGYVIVDGKKVMDTSVPDGQIFLWAQDTQDCSSAATGSSIFDFNGDGKAEVLYSDEIQFRIYDGPTGNVLFETCNTTGTLIEYPIVADVDNDGHADIVVVSNAYAFACNGTKQSGVRIFGSKKNDWVRTRRVWNQHSYHVTNIEEDGTVPQVELPNWKQPGLNNFRQNKQPGAEFAAPDLVVTLGPDCGDVYGLVATVRNVGQAAVPPGVVVGFYAGDPGSSAPLGKGTTSKTLYPAEAENVILPLPTGSEGISSGAITVYAVVDDGSPAHPWQECRTDNNSSGNVLGVCKQ